MLVELRPEGVVGQRRVEENRLGVGQRDLLALAELLRLAEVEQVGVLVFGQSLLFGPNRTLGASILALDRARDVDPADLFGLVIDHALAKD